MPHPTSFGMLNKAGGCELQEQRHTPLQLQVRLRLQNTHIMNVELICLRADFLLLVPALGMGFLVCQLWCRLFLLGPLR